MVNSKNYLHLDFMLILPIFLVPLLEYLHLTFDVHVIQFVVWFEVSSKHLSLFDFTLESGLLRNISNE